MKRHLLTNEAVAAAKSRILGIRLAKLTLRLRVNWTELLGDADTAAIALAIVAISSDRLLRENLGSDLESLQVPIPTKALASCNISSIATATGFNRETARRKVDQLVRLGMVVRDGSQITLAPGYTQRDEVISMIRTQLDELRIFTNDMVSQGVFVLEP